MKTPQEAKPHKSRFVKVCTSLAYIIVDVILFAYVMLAAYILFISIFKDDHGPVVMLGYEVANWVMIVFNICSILWTVYIAIILDEKYNQFRDKYDF